MSSCEKMQSNVPSSVIDDIDKGKKSSEVSFREQVQTSFMVYNTEGRTSSEDLN